MLSFPTGTEEYEALMDRFRAIKREGGPGTDVTAPGDERPLEINRQPPEICYDIHGNYIPRAQREKTSLLPERYQYKLSREQFMDEWTQRQRKREKETERRLAQADRAVREDQEEKIRELEEKVKSLEAQLQKKGTDDLTQLLIRQCIQSNQVMCQLLSRQPSANPGPQMAEN